MQIVFEGIDGSGKSTQLQMFSELVAGLGVRSTVAGGTRLSPVRRLYKELISHAETFPSALTSTLLSLADHAHQTVKRHNGKSHVQFRHRYIYSTLADALALELDVEGLLPVVADLFPKPAAVVVIDTSPRRALRHKGGACSLAEAGGPQFVARYGDRAAAFLEYQGRVSSAYRWMAKSGARLGTTIHLVDGDRDVRSVHDDVKQLLTPLVPAVTPPLTDFRESNAKPSPDREAHQESA